MSDQAQIDGYVLLYKADMQANCKRHWERVITQLRIDNPRLAQKVEAKIK